MKQFFIAGVLALTCALPAYAGNDNDGGCKGNCPNTGGGTSEANAGALGVGVGVGVGIGGAGGEGGHGGQGGTAIAGGGQASALALGVQGQGQKQSASSDQTQSQSLTGIQANGQTVTTGAQSSSSGGNTQAINFQGQASSAFGQGEIGRRVCGVVIGGGFQSLGHGYSAGIPLPAPQCNSRENLAYGIEGAKITSNPAFWADVLMEAYVTGEKPAKVYRRRASAAQ